MDPFDCRDGSTVFGVGGRFVAAFRRAAGEAAFLAGAFFLAVLCPAACDAARFAAGRDFAFAVATFLAPFFLSAMGKL